MARVPSGTHQRQLTLTEELEKLEQSITLTLQGKDLRTNHVEGRPSNINKQKSITTSVEHIA